MCPGKAMGCELHDMDYIIHISYSTDVIWTALYSVHLICIRTHI